MPGRNKDAEKAIRKAARKRNRQNKRQRRIDRRDRQLGPSTPAQRIFGPIAGFGGVVAVKKAIDKYVEGD
jgi:hypothetical protein|tara:strand:- start:734 stop:943 length:210 start_codon:yes stop_codon:yes gene_type:complete